MPYSWKGELSFTTDPSFYIPDAIRIDLKGLETYKKKLPIKKVIFSKPATIVLWEDGSKTVVKCEGEEFDKEKGLAMCLCKKFFNDRNYKGHYFDVFEEWCGEE